MLAKGVVHDTWPQALIAREAEFPTGIMLEQHAIAIPHCEAIHAKSSAIYLLRPTNKVHFQQAEVAAEVETVAAVEPEVTVEHNHATAPMTRAPAPEYVPEAPRHSDWQRPTFAFEGKGAAGGHTATHHASAAPALVCGPDRDYLWILSRTPTISDEVKQEMLAVATREGFDVSKFIWVQQPGSY